MKANAWQDTSKANWIDYLLCWLTSVFAVFSCGQAVASNYVSLVGVVGVSIGVLLSFLIRSKFEKFWFVKIDGILYAVVAWGAVVAARSINISIFPEDTFPPELAPSSWLLWMTIFGSFFCWRDGTIVFQSIPAVAIFGFVGCYDTFRYVVFFFFLFLICFATLFARAHGRDMQNRAVDSGFFRLGQGMHLSPSEQSMSLREGPWRWAAGAEWALGSALVIVVLSLLGAPVIQATAKPLAGIVSVRSPRLRTPNNTSSSQEIPNSTAVGTGPVSLSDTPYFELRGDIPDYLRVATYNLWSGKSWSNRDPGGGTFVDRISGGYLEPEPQPAAEHFKYPNKKSGQYWDDYRSQVLKITALLPTREILQAGNDPNFSCGRPIDNSTINMQLNSADRYDGTLTYDKVPELKSGSSVPDVIDTWLNSYFDPTPPSGGIRDLTAQVTKGLHGDLDKAMAIQHEISSRIKYNMRAEATPSDQDAAEYALFKSHEGYCDIFATAMVEMARSARIPARYCVGYLVDPVNRNSQGTQTLLESDRHAWAELYFEDIGWVPFDATAGAEVVPGGGPKDNKPTDTAAILRTIGMVLNFLIIGAIVTGIVVFIRMRRLPKTASMIRNELDLEYVKFIAAIWKYTGHRRLLSETTNEYLRRVGDQLGELKESAFEIGTTFTNVMFGPIDVNQTDVESARTSVQDFRNRLIKMPKSA